MYSALSTLSLLRSRHKTPDDIEGAADVSADPDDCAKAYCHFVSTEEFTHSHPNSQPAAGASSGIT
jgi:hypothetical protein